jgi:F-type H+-transporting ATPase subunit b
LEALGINLGYLFVQIFNFAVLFLLLKAWVYEPIVKMIENRRVTIEQGLEDARVAADARANAEQEAKKILTEAQSKATEIIQEATARAEVAAKEVHADAEAEAAKVRGAALAEAELERNRILADMRGQVAALAMAAAQKIISETLDEQRQRALIDEFFAGVKSGKIIVLEDSGLVGSSAEVTSALPLTGEEQEAVKRDVLAQIGEHATVTFRVDPSILGGLIIRVGDKVLDGSVAGQLGELRQRVG